MMPRIQRSIAAFKRALQVAGCPDGWQTIEEYDDIRAALNGRSLILRLHTGSTGRPRKHLTDDAAAAARAEAKRRYRERQKMHKEWAAND